MGAKNAAQFAHSALSSMSRGWQDEREGEAPAEPPQEFASLFAAIVIVVMMKY